MLRICDTADCGRRYDDARAWTICPHMPLEGPPAPRSVDPARGYCREHDLFGCPLHDDSPAPTDIYGACDTRAPGSTTQGLTGAPSVSPPWDEFAPLRLTGAPLRYMVRT